MMMYVLMHFHAAKIVAAGNSPKNYKGGKMYYALILTVSKFDLVLLHTSLCNYTPATTAAPIALDIVK